MKSKSTAAVLAFFLGGLGIHRFYLNQVGYGFLYLIFCWTFVPAAIALVDFIIFITMDDAKFNAKYNGGKAIATAGHSSGTNTGYAGNNNSSLSDELQKLYDIKEKGIITELEFQTQKEKLMRQGR